MHTLQITVQRKVGDGWPLVADLSAPGQFLPMRTEGLLHLAIDALHTQPTPLAYGTALGRAIFSAPLDRAFVQALAASDNALRVLLYVEADDLKSLHWSLLCGPLDSRWSFLVLNQRTLFSLYLPAVTDRRFPSIGRRDLRALAIVASPPGLENYGLTPFDVANTVTHLRTAFDTMPFDILAASSEAIGPPSLDAFCARIVAERYSLVHVVCHGAYSQEQQETSLFLSDAEGRLDRVSGSRLLQRLSQLDAAAGLPHLAFLAACETARADTGNALGSLAQRLVRQLGMPAVIAMTDRVTLATAQELASAFYHRLRVHGEVDRALTEATTSLAEHSDILVPALFSRLGGRPLFSHLPDRPLTPAEVTDGLEQLLRLLVQLAPVLLPKAQTLTAKIRSGAGIGPANLSAALNTERAQALVELDQLCLDALDMDFRALALGQPPLTYDARAPFRGLASFRTEDQTFFFGREPLVAQLTHRLQAEHFLALVGGSGSGKSSLAFAGIAPAMQLRWPDLAVRSMTPGRTPVETLDALLGDTASSSGNLLLIIDQFEELFTLTQQDAERLAFCTRLATIFRRIQQEAAPIYILLTLRAEFLGEATRFSELRDLLQRHQELIAPMNQRELRSAIEQQASVVGLRFEADLANTMLDDVAGEPGAMPLLQHALLELWKRRHGRWLRAEEYRAMGGVKQAIAGTANDLYASLNAADKARIERLFLRLVRLDASEEQRDTRRRASLDEIVRNADELVVTKALIARLADARLLVTSVNPSDGRQEVELAHEAIIAHWDRLQGWLTRDRQGLLVFQQISVNAAQWKSQGQDPSYLFQGSRLRQARRWATANQASLNQTELDFLAQSRRHSSFRQILTAAAALLAIAVCSGTLFALINEQGWFSRHLARSALAEFTDQPVSELLWLTDKTLLAGMGKETARQSDIAQSQDGGKSWTWTALPGTHVAALAQAGEDTGIVYALIEEAGLFRREDTGADWQFITATLPITTYDSLAVAPDGVLYIGDYLEKRGVFSSVDGGYHWAPLTGSPAVAVFNLAWLHEQLAVSAGDGLWLWHPAGTWQKWPAEGETPVLSTVAWRDALLTGGGSGIVEVDRQAQGTVQVEQLVTQLGVGRHTAADKFPQGLAGSYDGRLLYTSAKGDWRIDEDTVLPFMYAIHPDPIDPATFWVATSKGLEKVQVRLWHQP